MTIRLKLTLRRLLSVYLTVIALDPRIKQSIPSFFTFKINSHDFSTKNIQSSSWRPCCCCSHCCCWRAVSACEVPPAFAALIEPVGFAAIAVPGFATVGMCPAIVGVPILLVSLLFLMSAAGVPAIVDFPIVARVPGFEYLLLLASLLSLVSLLVLASLLPYSLLTSLGFKVSPASFVVTVLSPAFLLMLGSRCCWRPALAGVNTVAA
jgi:hypothetical protein